MSEHPADSASDVLIPTSLAAKLLAVSRWTVWRIPRGTLPYVTTPGSHRRYRRADVEAYRARHDEAPAPSGEGGGGSG